jgi:hypothetical protein
MIKTITLAVILILSATVSGLLQGASFNNPLSFLIVPPPDEPEFERRIDATQIPDAAPFEQDVDVIDPTLLEPYESDGLPQWQSSCPIPKPVFEAIVEHAPKHERAWYAGVAKQESGFDCSCYHYDNDGGYAHGLFCLHSHWRKEDVQWMGDKWRDPEVNLIAFQRTLEDHKTYWPGTRYDPREAAARYNGGGKPNWVYADKVMSYAKQFEKWFA